MSSYQAMGWGIERTIVLVSMPKKSVSNHPVLFESINRLEQYEYKAFVTNVEFSAPLVHELYNKRANAKNRIKDLKYDCRIEGFALNQLGAMEASYRYVMVAYNVMVIFKQLVMRTRKGEMLSTIMFQCFALGSYQQRKGAKKHFETIGSRKTKAFFRKLLQ